MSKLIKITLIVSGVMLVGIGLVVFSFVQSMKPDKDEEQKVEIQAEQYLEKKFNDNFEVYDTLYDNMGNFGFEYAAMVREQTSNTQFFVYYDDQTNQMVDTYIAEKWAGDLESKIQPFIRENFGEKTDFHVYFDDKIGEALGIEYTESRNYKDFNVAPIIRMMIPRKKSDEDENLFDEFISFLKSEDILQKGSVIVGYVAENGEILEDSEWSKEF